MSQTLSLQPGKYALFISPPVAGVDYTGTPLPTVSYQWKKNGTAIAGQTNATISGVWVEQTGGTVDLVDGDVISIDIILTNPVSVATKTIAATIDSAIPAPVISPVSIRQLSGGTYQTVTSLANTDIGEQLLVASNTGGTVTTTPPVLTTYQWRRNSIAIAGSTAQTYTLQSADADSVIDCVVTATNSGGTATATATVVVGTVADAGGWTALTPSADSRLIYVSNDGNDAAAASAKGRGYYLPSDSEIGADPTNPVGPIVAYGTTLEAVKRFRGRGWDGTDLPGGIPSHSGSAPPPNSNGYPDWLLFRRGQTFDVPQEVQTGYGVKTLTPAQMIGWWHNPTNQFTYFGRGASGRSESEPGVVTAWGPPTEAKPVVTPFGPDSNSRDMALVSIDCAGPWQWRSIKTNGSDGGNTADGLLVEDCTARSLGYTNTTVMSGATFRRCVVTGEFSSTGHNQGLLVGGDNSILIEECVFDRNGYKDNPFDATTWRGGPAGDGGTVQVGTGVQPYRSAKDRNMYFGSYSEMTVRGNVVSRDGGGGSVQMREGGVCERNLFIWNESACGMSHPEAYAERLKGSLFVNNVVLHDDHFLPTGGWGTGATAGGGLDDRAVLADNILAHFHRFNNGSQSLGVVGKSLGTDVQRGLVWPATKLMHAVIKDNAIYREFGGIGIMVRDNVHDSGVLDADVTGNAVSTPWQLSMQGNNTKPAEFVYSGNKFHAATGSGLFRWGWESNSSGDYLDEPFTDGTFSQWQSAGFDADGTFTTDFSSFKSAAGWTAPERDIVSYMQSVDPTYVVNEDVYVDDDATVKQAVRQKVWEILMNRSLLPGGNFWNDVVMDEARAKLTARRYHAFITFIQRAKANRKGAWDTRWTAEAVNNYIREGFGKAPVTGAYDNRSLATRLAEYAS